MPTSHGAMTTIPDGTTIPAARIKIRGGWVGAATIGLVHETLQSVFQAGRAQAHDELFCDP